MQCPERHSTKFEARRWTIGASHRLRLETATLKFLREREPAIGATMSAAAASARFEAHKRRNPPGERRVSRVPSGKGRAGHDPWRSVPLQGVRPYEALACLFVRPMMRLPT